MHRTYISSVELGKVNVGIEVANSLAAALVLVSWMFSRPAPSRAELPRELKPRVELFTGAWLKRDWPRMRLLVTPGEDD